MIIAGRRQGEACGGDGAATEANQQLVHQPEEAKLAQQLPVSDRSKIQAQALDTIESNTLSKNV